MIYKRFAFNVASFTGSDGGGVLSLNLRPSFYFGVKKKRSPEVWGYCPGLWRLINLDLKERMTVVYRTSRPCAQPHELHTH